MKTTMLLLLLLLCSTLSAQSLFPPETAPPPTPAEEVVKALEEGMNAALLDKVARVKNLWETLWENPRATPEAVLAQWGPRAAKAFRLGAIANADLAACAAEAGTTVEVLLGDPKYLAPKFPVVINHETGHVVLQNP